ncbi:IS110 family transposase [Pirellulales bacterium]|nr:IS110 family transposase [Pirellulales bacterium]
MRYVGVDLHKKTISLCVIELEGRTRKIIERRRFRCDNEESMADYFIGLGDYQVVVEATASYEWFVQMVEKTADRVVLAHPGHLRVIAQSKRKTDKLDAQTLAEFLALDQIPESWRPTPRVREHRTLVRHRSYMQKRITSVKNKLRRVLANYNADQSNLFTAKGRKYLASITLSGADRFTVNQLCEELDQHGERLTAVNKQLRAFAKDAPAPEREARAVLGSMPCVGPVTFDVVLAEVGDIRRFSSGRKTTAYAGLAPGIRESAGKAKQLGITKEGSRLLRSILVETAWRLVNKTRRWGALYEKLRLRCGAKKAIVAVARRVWCVMTAMLKSGQEYRPPGRTAA